MSRPRRSFGIVILASLLIPVVPFVLVGEVPGERWLSAADDSAALFGFAGASLLLVDIFVPVPSSVVVTLLGARLGLLPGWAFAWGGLVLGNALGFAAARLLKIAPELEIAERPTWWLVLATRPVPVLAEAVVFTAGAAGAGWRAFLGSMVVGNGIYAGVMAANGSALLPDAWAGPGLVLPLLLPLAAWGSWLLYRRRAGLDGGAAQ